MDREVSVADCKQYQRTNNSKLQYMPGAERHTKVLTNVVVQWVARLTRNRQMLVSREF